MYVCMYEINAIYDINAIELDTSIPDERDINELVPKVIPRNRRFSICRDLVATEKRVSTVIVVMIVTTVIDIHIYVYIYRCICILVCVSLYIYIYI